MQRLNANQAKNEFTPLNPFAALIKIADMPTQES